MLMNQHLRGIAFPKLVCVGREIDLGFDSRRAWEIEVQMILSSVGSSTYGRVECRGFRSTPKRRIISNDDSR
jgi:hypothetical protein